ncbi:Guanine deaminase [Varanus komodoensis]|nr:Guanine deaminase [Varanus komodoensis]
MGSPQAAPLAHVFKGTFAHSDSSSPMVLLQGHLLGVQESGQIAFLEPAEEQDNLAKKWGFKSSDIRELSNYEFFMPGLIDAHIHAPQYSFAGIQLELPLLEWLKRYTFPTEAKYKDIDFAEEVYTRAVRRTLKNGTTTACYFATIHTDASLLLADIIAGQNNENGMRTVVYSKIERCELQSNWILPNPIVGSAEQFTLIMHSLSSSGLLDFTQLAFRSVKTPCRESDLPSCSVRLAPTLEPCGAVLLWLQCTAIAWKVGHTNSCSHVAPSVQSCSKKTDKFGQRAFVGKVCMDLNESLQEYKESTTESVEETERFVRGVLEKKYPRVHPIVTPRFGPSCTEELLSKLGNLAKNHNIHVQSHISESEGEIKLVENMFPSYQNYTELYDKNKLLTNKTIMAHGCYLSDEELDVFNLRGAAIVHCPNSNISLSSGLLNAKKVLKHDVKLGLGTDVAGGYSASMLDAIRKAIMVSNILNINKEDETALTLKEAFRLATLGGSQALGLDTVTGNFEVGKEFDALLINTKASDSPFDVFASDTPEDLTQKFLYLGDDRNIEEVYVAGKLVVPFSSSV